MLFANPPSTANDILAFSARFSEGIRVEYKSTFDDNVRRNLPKIISSFANSLGGVCVIGVETVNGVPRLPIQGILIPADEIPLTIENICLQNLNPPIIPQSYVIPSTEPGRCFVVIEIQESWEAPHAIENSKRVYVRTGNSGNPYELADVDLIIELVRRRAEPTARRDRLVRFGRDRAKSVVDDRTIYAEIVVSPSYPRRPLCTRQQCWDFVSRSGYRGRPYFPLNTLRRVDDGVASYDRDRQYGQVSADGVLLIRRLMEPAAAGDQNPILAQNPVLLSGDVLHPTHRLLHCAEAFYRRVGFRGSLAVEATLNNVRSQRMAFIRTGQYGPRDPNVFLCFEDTVSATRSISSEALSDSIISIAQMLMQQICWSFWQDEAPFPSQELEQYTTQILNDIGFS